MRAGGLGRPELLPAPVDVHRRPAELRGPGIEVQILPGEPEHLGHPPPLEEQQPHRGAEPMIPHRPQQGPRLVPVEGPAVRLTDPQRLDRPHRVADERTDLHGLVHDLGEHLAVMAHRPRRKRPAQPSLPLRVNVCASLERSARCLWRRGCA
jgi:hypothetical protein